MHGRSSESARSAARDRRVVLAGEGVPIALGLDDLCRHTLILGSSGAGKTTRAFNPLLVQMLAQFEAGAFIVAPKPEAVAEAVEIANRAGREVLVVEPGSEVGLELLSGSPDVDSMYLRDALGHLGGEDNVYLDAAVVRLKNVLRMLQAAGSQHYTLEHLSSYCFDERYAAIVRVHAAEHLRGLPSSSDEAWTINEALSYEDTRYFQFPPEIRRGIQFAVSQLLEPLRDAKIVKTFASKRGLVPIESVFDGKVIVLHIPRSEYDRAAHVIYTIAKRRFFGAIENRRANPALDQRRPVVLAIDEYQLCISESDVLSLGIVRSAGCMVLATAHGVASLNSVLPARHVEAALQNFTQKIFFKTDDHETLGLLDRVTRHAGAPHEATRLFAMTRDQAMCHLTIGDRSIDTVLDLLPLYVSPHYLHEAAPHTLELESVA
jgi:hypothetical protein